MILSAMRWVTFLLLLLTVAVESVRAKSLVEVEPTAWALAPRGPFLASVYNPRMAALEIRGGSDEEESEEEDESDDDAEAEGGVDLSAVIDKAASVTQSTIVPATKKAALTVYKWTKKLTLTSYGMMQRAIQAAMEADDTEVDGDDEEEEASVVQKIVSTVQRMIKAAFTFPETEDDEEEGEVSDDGSDFEEEEAVEANVEDEVEAEEAVVEKPKKEKKTKEKKKKQEKDVPTKPTDFGTYLATQYGVDDSRTAEAPGSTVLGGSLATAMQEARAQARLLVVFIPSEKPKKGKESKEAIAIESILSAEVGEAANEKARNGEDTGSFLFWSAKVGSSEATTAMKRLKAKPKSSKGGKCPVLMVVYPAMVVDSSTGQSKIVPKVLGQHHCNPPPASSAMSNWLGSLRKRHGKQYMAMQTVLKELQYFKERKEGYLDSAKSDKERQKREAEEEAKRLAAEKAEEERLEALATRRKELKESLPEEPEGNDVKKIALRFADGKSAQRRFRPDQPVVDIFNWVDAHFELEREKVVLTTLNGKQTLEWEGAEQTLEDAGLGKNTGFRVTVKEDSKEDDKADDDDDSESS
eukprot:CAMPEP_0176019992 /NCGR_PEP_ID=MMETSP0120_2-20121206/9673_1 /TAXON_ID=160619 /ORGANISM="Kryptoperidinium foliaceum, Strain CCMP 1326" /LENGTH=581 /DNA_ID=CAMNT_0017353079 /DNA_START=65 /DNA_END=1810 /DNA_ORIENTATION=+